MKNFFYHAKTSPRVTISAEITNDVMCFSAARCGKKDQFNKKTGRQIALGRLHKNKCIRTLSIPNSTDVNKLFLTEAILLVEHVQRNKNFLVS